VKDNTLLTGVAGEPIVVLKAAPRREQ